MSHTTRPRKKVIPSRHFLNSRFLTHCCFVTFVFLFRYYNAPLMSSVDYTVWFGVVVAAGDKTKTTYIQVRRIKLSKHSKDSSKKTIFVRLVLTDKILLIIFSVQLTEIIIFITKRDLKLICRPPGCRPPLYSDPLGRPPPNPPVGRLPQDVDPPADSPVGRPPPPFGQTKQTNTCENITLPQTSFVDGNNACAPTVAFVLAIAFLSILSEPLHHPAGGTWTRCAKWWTEVRWIRSGERWGGGCDCARAAARGDCHGGRRAHYVEEVQATLPGQIRRHHHVPQETKLTG